MNMKTPEKLSNKKHIITFVSILLFLGFIASSFVSYYTTSELYEKDLSENILPLTGDNIYSEIRKDIIELVLISSLMANDTFLMDWVVQGEKNIALISKYLKNIQKQYNTVTSFFASDLSHAYYHPTGLFTTINKNNPRDAWYYRVKNLEEDYEINLGIDNANKNAMTIFINYKVYNYEGKFIGITGCGITVKNVQELLDNYASRYQRIIYFVNQQHQVLLSNQITPPSFTSTTEIKGLNHLDLSKDMLEPVSCEYQRDHATYLLNTRFIPELGLYLFVEQSLKGANRQNLVMLLLKNFFITLSIGAVIITAVYSTVKKYQDELEAQAMTDKLTGATNRHAFELLFSQSLREAKRGNRPLTLVLFDVDHFKKVNDRYGHPAGDAVLVQIAETAKNKIRDADSLCRWGGEEFLILLKNCSLEDGRLIAEELRSEVEQTTIEHNNEHISVQISLGVAQWQTDEKQKALLQRVDEALYQAKNSGRNRVVLA